MSYKIKVSNEAIKMQHDVEFINEISTIFEDILDEYETVKPITNLRFGKRKSIQNKLEEIDSIVLKRFGYNIKHVSGDNIGYATIPPTALNLNVLGGDIEQTFKTLKRGSERTQPSSTHDINSFDTQRKQLLANSVRSYRELNKVMNTKGVIIDEDKAYIRGLNQDFVAFKIISFDVLNRIEATAREYTAALIHEIGHDFTWISESYRSIKMVGSLMEAMQESSDKPLRARLKLMNRRMGGKKIDLKPEDTEEQMYIKFQNRFLGELPKMTEGNTEVSVESERMADEFAVRFGLGKELASLFMKFDSVGIRPFKFDYTLNAKLSKILTMLFLMSMVSYGLITLFQLFAYFIITIIITTTLLTSTVNIVIGSEMSNDKVYDVLIRRLKRVRLVEIRILRESEDEDIIRNKMETVRYLDSLISEMGDGRGYFQKLGDIMPWNYSAYKVTKMSRTLEDGIDNALHASKHRKLEG